MSKHFFALSLLVAFSFNAKDSSLAMMLEAMRREWEVYSLDTTDLFADKEGVYAHASPTTVADNPEHWFEKQPYPSTFLHLAF
jgi:glutathione synthase/RimK-type ligase-like ATP-grasp enzyme